MIWALLLAGVPLDQQGKPLPLYLTLADVALHLRTLEPSLKVCSAEREQTLPVTIRFEPKGTLAVTWETVESGPLRSCVQAILEKSQAPIHHDVAFDARTTLYVRDGRIFLSPSPSMDARLVDPLMLFIDEERTPRETVIRHLNSTPMTEE